MSYEHERDCLSPDLRCHLQAKTLHRHVMSYSSEFTTLHSPSEARLAQSFGRESQSRHECHTISSAACEPISSAGLAL